MRLPFTIYDLRFEKFARLWRGEAVAGRVCHRRTSYTATAFPNAVAWSTHGFFLIFLPFLFFFVLSDLPSITMTSPGFIVISN